MAGDNWTPEERAEISRLSAANDAAGAGTLAAVLAVSHGLVTGDYGQAVIATIVGLAVYQLRPGIPDHIRQKAERMESRR